MSSSRTAGFYPPYGRTGVIVDPFGHRWIVSTAMSAT
jgi:hypothetical protein